MNTILSNIMSAEKTCSRCKIPKARSEFHRHPTAKDGLQSRCKTCVREVACAYQQSQINSNPDWRRSRAYKYLYGITLEEVNEMLNSQDGKCAICDKKFQSRRDTCLDHNHSTNKVRQLLCSRCNVLVGYLETSSPLLDKATEYLRKWNN